MKEKIVKSDKAKGEIILYQAPDGNLAIDVKLEEETVWLTQVQMARLFEQTKQTVSEHVNNIYKEGEIERDSTVRKYLTVQTEGKRSISREREYYNLDVIISVGYRVKSKRGTQFRIWANKILKEYLVKGYVLNEKKLKEQSERIREIEAALKIFSKVAANYELSQNEFAGILKVVSDYTHALDLLYFIIKKHSFVDGNKRIAAAIFLWFLDKNRILYKQNGVKRLADNTLAALCLMIAESKPKEKEIITKVVVNLINKNN
ncbi:MAG: virulence protein RhuM/Fic/DOC family protein [Bacteroidota bacterium]